MGGKGGKEEEEATVAQPAMGDREGLKERGGGGGGRGGRREGKRKGEMLLVLVFAFQMLRLLLLFLFTPHPPRVSPSAAARQDWKEGGPHLFLGEFIFPLSFLSVP